MFHKRPRWKIMKPPPRWSRKRSSIGANKARPGRVISLPDLRRLFNYGVVLRTFEAIQNLYSLLLPTGNSSFHVIIKQILSPVLQEFSPHLILIDRHSFFPLSSLDAAAAAAAAAAGHALPTMFTWPSPPLSLSFSLSLFLSLLYRLYLYIYFLFIYIFSSYHSLLPQY